MSTDTPGCLPYDAALALAAQHGHAAIVATLIDAGENVNRFNPREFHAHATPLHHTAGADHLDVVQLLVERGARLDIRDTIYRATPRGWAEHGGCARTAESLRTLEAQVIPAATARVPPAPRDRPGPSVAPPPACCE